MATRPRHPPRNPAPPKRPAAPAAPAAPPPLPPPLPPPGSPLRPGKRGPAPHAPTERDRQLVKVSVAAGQTQAQIARVMGMSEAGLRNHYKRELETGGDEIHRAVAANLASIALDRNHPKAVTAAIFMLKTRWREHWREDAPGGLAGGLAGGAALSLTAEGAGPVRFTISIGDKAPAPPAGPAIDGEAEEA